jgi:hypothetical protein
VLHVECAPCGIHLLEPQVIWFGARRVDVRGVVDRWYGSNQRWWKVETDEGFYIVRLDEATRAWELAAVVGE